MSIIRDTNEKIRSYLSGEPLYVMIKSGGQEIASTSGKYQTIISIDTHSDKKELYDTCRIVLDNNRLQYNNMFEIDYEDFKDDTKYFDKLHEINIIVRTEDGKEDVIFGGFVRRTIARYNSTQGYTYVIDCASYEWVLSVVKLEKELEIKTGEDPMNAIKLLVSAALPKYPIKDMYIRTFHSGWYKNTSFHFQVGLSYLHVIRKICFSLLSVYWIDARGNHHIVRRDEYFDKPSLGLVPSFPKLKYGEDIISAEFEEIDLNDYYEKVVVHAYALASSWSKNTNVPRTGVAGARLNDKSKKRVLHLYLGFLSSDEIQSYLNILAKDILKRVNGTPFKLSLTINGKPNIKAKETRLENPLNSLISVKSRNDIVYIYAPMPLDMGVTIQNEIDRPNVIRRPTRSNTIAKISSFFRRRADIMQGFYFVNSVSHSISASGYITKLELSQKYYETKTDFMRFLNKEMMKMIDQTIFVGYIHSVNASKDPPIVSVKLRNDEILNNVRLSTWNTSINQGVYYIPKVNDRVIIARISASECYVIASIYTDETNNKKENEIRIGEHSIKIDSNGNLTFGVSGGTAKRIALEDHTHTLTSSHTHIGNLGNPTGPPTNQDSAQEPTTGLSNSKIKCEK
nr:MAG: hypothetical protein [Lokiarchaeota virus Ratatoskr Meg22_1012]